MLTHLRHARAGGGLAQSLGRLASASRAVRTKKTSTAAMSKTKTPVAKKLHEAKIWSPSKRTPKGQKDAYSLGPIDARRVNIVSERLCEDIIQRLGPSLERHRGCDLFDINPGASVWSKALHDAVQPRRHIMMDASAEQYRPFREEIMGDRRNIEVISKSGIVWGDLNEVLASHLDSHHERRSHNDEPQRNDTLLVTANLSTYPKKAMWNFENVATMVLYQFLSSIRASSLFQRYGLVRMLIWVNDENKRRVLPRSMLGRKRSAFEAELSCEWIHEVAGHDMLDPSSERLALRDEWMHYESAANALRRMQDQGIVTPRGRETRLLQALKADPSLLHEKLAGHRAPNLQRPFKSELEEMEALQTDDQDQERLRMLRLRDRYDLRESGTYLELLQLHEKVLQMDPSSPEFAAADRDFHERVENLKKNPRNEFLLIRDSYHLFRHQPMPALLWDRRAYEPLAIDPTEFYPNAPTCLLDIQPKAMNPVLRQHGPSSSRSGDFSNILLRTFFNNTVHPVYPRAMDTAWPGFADMAREHCPSLWDPAAGGSPMSGHGTFLTRAMNEQHWAELVNAWMRWPFRPSYSQMLGRSTESDEMEDEAELKGSAMGGGN